MEDMKTTCPTTEKNGGRWWESEKLRIFIAGGTNDLAADCEFDADELARTIAGTGANVTELYIGALRIGLPVYCRTSLSVGCVADKLGEWVDAMHRHSLRVMVYVNVHAVEREFALKHPEFLQFMEDGNSREIYGTDFPMCPNSPSAREWIDQFHQDILRYDVDMIHHDGTLFYPACCYCQFCQSLYLQKTGKVLPSRSDPAHPDLPGMIRFLEDSVVSWYEYHADRIRSINPNIALMTNLGEPRSAQYQMGKNTRRVSAVFDFINAEVALKRGNLNTQSLIKTGLDSRLMDTVSGGRYAGVIGLMHKPHEYSHLPAPELILSCAEVAAHNGNFYAATRIVTRDLYEPFASFTRFLRQHDSYYHGTKSVAKTALLWPTHTINFIPQVEIERGDMEEEKKAGAAVLHGNPVDSFHGAAELLLRAHVPFDVIDETELLTKDLSRRYLMLVTANAVCLSEDHACGIRRYVREGGALLASQHTSLCNEYGVRQTGLRLGDLFGIAATGDEIGPRALEHMGTGGIAEDHRVTRHMHRVCLMKGPDTCRDQWIPGPEYILDCRLQGGAALLVHSEKALGASGSGRPPRPDVDPLPALVYNREGRGHAFYLNGLFFRDYFMYRYPDYGTLMGAILDHARCRLVRLENAPESVEIVLRRKDDDTLILHLINHTGAMTRPVTRILSLTDIQIHIDAPEFAPASATALWAGKDLPFTKNDDGPITLGLPHLDIYEAIVLKRR